MLAALAASLSVACSDDESDDVLTMTYMAGFVAQANLPFVAVYVAEDQGFFADENLEVEIQHAGFTGAHKGLVLSGEVDITTLPASEMLQIRANTGAPYVAVMLFGQRGDFGYAVLNSSGISSPSDFVGRDVGFKGIVQAEFHAMLAAHGLTTDDMNMIDVGFNPVVLVEQQVEVYPVFLSNEPDTLTRKLNQEITVFEAADDGVPTLGVVYLVGEEFLEDETNREKLERFLRATVRAFEFAVDDPAAAIESTAKFLAEDPEPDLEHERFILDTEIENALSDLTRANGVGWFTQQQFRALTDVLLEYGALDNDIDLEAALDRSFLEDIHQ
ncbi:MAG: ABC transporter substrate-binding protein [Chloroflexota bacterium]|nr:ABC transporter substrate-binding protein [Chloroflexota bacterium]MDE2896496.1 ABC transporter substrate-binding protein [Chloroflexota bacterium]